MTVLREMRLDGEEFLLIPVSEAPEHIAQAFAEFSDIEQAEFFHHVHRVARSWAISDIQWCEMVERMSNEARAVLRSMAQFLEKE